MERKNGAERQRESCGDGGRGMYGEVVCILQGGGVMRSLVSGGSLAVVAMLPLLVACGAEADAPGVAEREDDDRGAAAGAQPSPSGADPAPPTSATPAPGAGAIACIAQPKCDGGGGPQLAAKHPFEHTLSTIAAASGPAFHRGRDQIYATGDAQWVIGKMTYTYLDKDLKDEAVDVFVERGCSGTWEKLGATRTTATDGAHATVEGVEDNGGRVFFEIPRAKELPVGRHRIRLVVTADQTSTDLLIDVVPKATSIVVSDVDGTLTSSESAEYPALLTGSLPDAQPDAANVLSALAAKGHRVVYLTARPEWLTARTREFLTSAGFPPGILHTTTGVTGAIGAAAASYKSGELAMLQAHGHTIAWAFGNKASDTDAYAAAKIQPADHRVFLQVTDTHGGRRIESYAQLLPIVTTLPAICQ